MKNLHLIALLVCVVHVSASVYSQNTRFTFETENMTVREVLKTIEAQSNFRSFL